MTQQTKEYWILDAFNTFIETKKDNMSEVSRFNMSIKKHQPDYESKIDNLINQIECMQAY